MTGWNKAMRSAGEARRATHSRLAILVLVALGLTLAACGSKTADEPMPLPPQVQATLDAVDSAFADGRLGVAADRMVAAGEALMRYSTDGKGLSPMMRADVRSIGIDAMAIGNLADLGRVTNAGAAPGDPSRPELGWTDVKTRLDRVLSGKPPTPGPRWIRKRPPEVKAAMEAVDDALARGDASSAGEAMLKVQGALYAWLEKAPIEKAQILNELVEADLSVSPDGMPWSKNSSLETIQTRWPGIKARIPK